MVVVVGDQGWASGGRVGRRRLSDVVTMMIVFQTKDAEVTGKSKSYEGMLKYSNTAYMELKFYLIFIIFI